MKYLLKNALQAEPAWTSFAVGQTWSYPRGLANLLRVSGLYLTAQQFLHRAELCHCSCFHAESSNCTYGLNRIFRCWTDVCQMLYRLSTFRLCSLALACSTGCDLRTSRPVFRFELSCELRGFGFWTWILPQFSWNDVCSTDPFCTRSCDLVHLEGDSVASRFVHHLWCSWEPTLTPRGLAAIGKQLGVHSFGLLGLRH